jgi:hypothetical protein
MMDKRSYNSLMKKAQVSEQDFSELKTAYGKILDALENYEGVAPLDLYAPLEDSFAKIRNFGKENSLREKWDKFVKEFEE